MPQTNLSAEALEQNQVRSLEVVIINSLPEVPAFAITFRQLLSRIRGKLPYGRNQLTSALIDLSKGFLHHDGNTYRLGVTAEKNKAWFGYHARYYIMRTPRS